MTERRDEQRPEKGSVSQAPVPSGKTRSSGASGQEGPEPTPATPSDTGQPDEQAVGSPPVAPPEGRSASRPEPGGPPGSFRDETGTEPNPRKPPPRH